MFNFSCPVKIDWLNIAFISDDVPLGIFVDTIVSDVESVFNASRQDPKTGFHGYAVRHPVGFFTGKNYTHVAAVSAGGTTKSKLGQHAQLSLSGSNADFYHRHSTYRQPKGYIQRIDLAYDVTCDYDVLINALRSLKELERLKWSTVTSTENGVSCTTTYIGSRESAYFVRVYEKGKQVGGDPEWVRLEFEVKPTKTSSDFAVWCYDQYFKNPEEILTRCRFAHAILSALFSNDVAPYASRDENRLPDTVRSFTHMIDQYSAVISGISELYDVSDMLTLAREVHRLKQSDDEAVRNSVGDVISDFLSSSRLHTPV